MGVVGLNQILGVNLTSTDILYVYQYMCSDPDSRTSYHLRAKELNVKPVNGLPDSNKGYNIEYLKVLSSRFTSGASCQNSFGFPGHIFLYLKSNLNKKIGAKQNKFR